MAEDIAKHQERVNKEARKGVEGRKKRDEESDSEAADARRERADREQRKARDTLEERTVELRKARDTLEERTGELKSTKQSLSSCNRARSENDKEILRLQKQLALQKKQREADKKKAEETDKSYNKVKETNRAKIADLEKELAVQAPILEGLDGRMDDLEDWSKRDALLRKEYLRLKANPPGEGDQAEKLRAAEAVLGILDRYLGEPQTGEPPSGSAEDTPHSGGSTLPGWGKGSKKREDPGGETQPSLSSKKGGQDKSGKQMRPDEETYGRLAQELRAPAVRPKRQKLTKKQKLEARKGNDEDLYGQDEACTTADPFGNDNADGTRLQAEADARARDIAVRKVNGLPNQEAGPKTRSSTSSAPAARSPPPSPAISLIESPPDSPVEYAKYADGRDRPVKDYSSGEDSDLRGRRRDRGRSGDEEAEEDPEGAEEEENEEADPPQGKEG